MKKRNIFQYIGEVLCIYSVSIILMTIFTKLFGDSAREISTMYTLGSQGIPLHMLIQFFVLAIIIVALKVLFFTEYIIKNMSSVMRTVLMLLSTIAVMASYICIFSWFPIKMWEPWAMFLICFGICFVTSAVVMAFKTNMENKKMEKGLERLQKKWEEEDDDKRKQH